jgi:hypothetical protein
LEPEKRKKRLNFVVVVAVAVAVVGPKNNSSSFSLPFSVFFTKIALETLLGTNFFFFYYLITLLK